MQKYRQSQWTYMSDADHSDIRIGTSPIRLQNTRRVSALHPDGNTMSTLKLFLKLKAKRYARARRC